MYNRISAAMECIGEFARSCERGIDSLNALELDAALSDEFEYVGENGLLDRAAFLSAFEQEAVNKRGCRIEFEPLRTADYGEDIMIAGVWTEQFVSGASDSKEKKAMTIIVSFLNRAKGTITYIHDTTLVENGNNRS